MIDISRIWRPVAIAAVIGGGVGWLIGSSVAWAVIGVVVALGVVVMVVEFDVRPMVAVPVGAGAGLGAYLGGTIVGVLCEPQGCPGFEATAAFTTGVGALVGIGLVVALATRSYDEYREAQERGTPPPTSSCSTDGVPNDSD